MTDKCFIRQSFTEDGPSKLNLIAKPRWRELHWQFSCSKLISGKFQMTWKHLPSNRDTSSYRSITCICSLGFVRGFLVLVLVFGVFWLCCLVWVCLDFKKWMEQSIFKKIKKSPQPHWCCDLEKQFTTRWHTYKDGKSWISSSRIYGMEKRSKLRDIDTISKEPGWWAMLNRFLNYTAIFVKYSGQADHTKTGEVRS